MSTFTALRPWATMPEVNRGMRAMLREALAAGEVEEPAGFVVLLSGAIPPEVIPSTAWRSVEGKPVAVAPLAVVRQFGRARGGDVARTLDEPPDPDGAWCIALGADGGAVSWSVLLVFGRHRQGAPVGDA